MIPLAVAVIPGFLHRLQDLAFQQRQATPARFALRLYVRRGGAAGQQHQAKQNGFHGACFAGRTSIFTALFSVICKTGATGATTATGEGFLITSKTSVFQPTS